MGLLDLPEAQGFDFREEDYFDKCHLCEDLRRFMKTPTPKVARRQIRSAEELYEWLTHTKDGS